MNVRFVGSCLVLMVQEHAEFLQEFSSPNGGNVRVPWILRTLERYEYKVLFSKDNSGPHSERDFSRSPNLCQRRNKTTMDLEPRGSNLRVSKNVPPSDPELAASLRAYQNVRRAAFCGFDDRSNLPNVYISTRFANSANVHLVEQPLGMRTQLTFCEEPVSQVYPVPASVRLQLKNGFSYLGFSDSTTPLFVYGQDSGGDENVQYYLWLSGTRSVSLTGTLRCPAPSVELGGRHPPQESEGGPAASRPAMNRSFRWEPLHGTSAVLSSNARDGKHFDLYILRTAQLGLVLPTRVWECSRSGYLVVQDFYGRHLLVQHYVSVTDSKLWLLELNEALDGVVREEEIGGAGGGEDDVVEASVGQSAQLLCSADGETVHGVLYTSDRGQGEFRSLRYFGGEEDNEIQTRVAWSVTDLVYCKTSGHLVVEYNEEGSTTYYHVNVFTKIFSRLGEEEVCMRKLILPGLELGVGGRAEIFSDDKNTLFGFSFTKPTAPSDVYVYNLSSSGPLEQWTRSEIGGLDAAAFAAPTLVRYPSFDGLQIPAFVYCPTSRPPAVQENTLVPVIIHPHGGPEGQHRPNFSPLYQYLLTEFRVAIIDPNVRGSSGYGKTFVSLWR